jgi:uncharacterized protein (DUF2267 family)
MTAAPGSMAERAGALDRTTGSRIMTTDLPVLATTVQETHTWLKSVMAHLHTEDRHRAYLALRAGLHALRDRLGPENAVHLGAQLPMLIRGLYYEGWRLVPGSKERHPGEMMAHVREELPQQGAPVDPNMALRATFAVLWEKLDPGEIAKIVRLLPAELESLWPEEARRR